MLKCDVRTKRRTDRHEGSNSDLDAIVVMYVVKSFLMT